MDASVFGGHHLDTVVTDIKGQYSLLRVATAMFGDEQGARNLLSLLHSAE